MNKKYYFILVLILLGNFSACKQIRVKSEGTEELKEEVAYLNKKIESLQVRIEELEKKNR